MMDEFDILLKQIIETQEEIDQQLHEIEVKVGQHKTVDQRTYEKREFEEAWKKWQSIEKGPLQDRREGRAKWKEALVDHPEIVAQRVGWMLAETWGYGVMLLMRRSVTSAKTDGAKVARAAQIAAAFEWGCSSTFARQAYNELTKAQQRKANGLILKRIKKWEKEQKEEQNA